MTHRKFGPKGWTPDRIGSLSGKTYAITGANSGAGFQATRTLLLKGASVVMMNRSVTKSETAINALKEEFGRDVKVSFVQMDLAVLQSVREAAAEVLQQFPCIDALICNAAIAQVPTQKLTVDGFESQLGVNYFGHFLLCGLLYERIEKSAGRIVIVGSNGYKMGLKRIKFEDLNFDNKYSAWNSYAQSKLAQMMFGYELQRRVQIAGSRVVVQVCHPGASRTNLINESAGVLNKIIWAAIAPIIAQSAEKGSWPEVMCATEKEVEAGKLYGPTKRADTIGAIDACSIDDCALDQDAAAKLWAISEEKTDLKWAI
ncbi:SDR family oxidoreductase [Hirschia litorea]|uniref:SDR family oxidoreductase n=1 Tax=Hirschia litorea TaxID=1199156 RepID=A0ABW2IJV9_9PROT